MREPSVKFTKEERAILAIAINLYIDNKNFPLGKPWPDDLMSLLKTLSEYEAALVVAKTQKEAKEKMGWLSFIRWRWKEYRKQAHRKLMLEDMKKYTEALKGTGDIDLDKLEVKEINGEKYYILK